MGSPHRLPKQHRVGFADNVERNADMATADKHAGGEHDYFGMVSDSVGPSSEAPNGSASHVRDLEKQEHSTAPGPAVPSDDTASHPTSDAVSDNFSIRYTDFYREAPVKSYRQSLRPCKQHARVVVCVGVVLDMDLSFVGQDWHEIPHPAR